MNTKILENIINEMTSEAEKLGKDKKSANKILELNKQLRGEIEK